MQQSTKQTQKAAYHHGDLRAHLVETVRLLVEEKGADGFSISEAARRAGVSSAAPYKHFEDRREIVRAVAVLGIKRMRQQMDDAARSATGEPLAPITALGICYAKFARTEPGVFRLIFGLTEGRDDDPELHALGMACEDVVKREVRRVMPEGTDEEEIGRRAYMLHMFVHGHAFLEIDGVHDNEISGAVEHALMADIAARVMA
ncbi:TetR/AcrR family transcriptional regulator [uncultured Tateyamaria sp.]|uniref:TetR/AcrR family transcriptional regulator n=1 Tax=uncultured Tateyamaria sp. TaxID=455651 RepID=UPI00262F99F8|nr:TetR/AcrR family transcriptional regulator [uncultured Tateyamaria sp.]